MQSYTEQTLTENEKIVYSEKVSKFYLMAFLILGSALSFIGFILLFFTLAIGIILLSIGILYLMNLYVLKHGTEFSLTTKRVVSKSGFIKRDVVEIKISKIESVVVDQSILGRVFNYGNLVISGAGNSVAVLINIQDPLEFRRQCLKLIDTDQSS